jgi:ribosomal-protein-alanine N-acetyltransferase
MADADGPDDGGGATIRVRTTERLRLEPVRREHADDLWRLHDDAGVAQWHGGTYSREEAEQYAAACEQAWLTDGTSKWIAYRRGDGALVGRGGVTLTMVDGEMRFEVGWTLLEEWWGHGYATEIGRAGLEFAFAELDVDEIVAFTEPHNTRSLAVMERLGMEEPREITHRGGPYVLFTSRRTGSTQPEAARR